MKTHSLQVEDGNFTRIVNPLLEELIRVPFKGCELAIALFLIRKTYGFNKKEDGISLSQIAKGTDRSRQTVVTALKNLQLVNIVRLVKRGDTKGSSNIWSINKYSETWKLVKVARLVKRSPKPSQDLHQNLVKTGRHTKEIKNNITKDTSWPTVGGIPDIGDGNWPGFEVLWFQHPRKENKRLASSAWNRLLPDENLRMLIFERHKLWCESSQWQKDNGQFVPLLANWLNDRRWQDEIKEEGGVVLDLSKMK